MNLNRLHNIFGKRRRIDREDIENYGRSSDPGVRNTIEQKAAADDFSADALEGWEQLGYNTSSLAALDKKFVPKSTIGWYVLGGSLIIGAIATLIIVANVSEPSVDTLVSESTTTELVTELMEDQQITLDESDVHLPDPIEQMNDAPKQNQVEPDAIKQDFHEMDVIRKEEPPGEIAELPIIDLDIEKPKDQTILRAHEFAKEIYLHDLKLVDYSSYRTAPQVKTRQMVLTGTPANMEDKESEAFDPTWKDVDVPYMEYIKKSISIFGRGNYKKALSRFETVLATYDMDINANFYAGVCLFNLDEHKLAITHFDACLNGPYSNFDEESIWMKALSYEYLGKNSEAKKLFKSIVGTNGFYARQAAEKLN